MISGKKTKNLWKKAQTGKHKHTHKKKAPQKAQKKAQTTKHRHKKSTAKSTKKKHKLPNTPTKKSTKKAQKKTTNYQTQAQKIAPARSGQTSFPEPASWPAPCLRQKFPELEPAPQIPQATSQVPPSPSLWGSCVWPLTAPPKFKFSQSTFCNKRRKKKAPARTQECTPSRLTPKRQTFDLASEVKNSSLHPV